MTKIKLNSKKTIEYHIRECEKMGWPYTAQMTNNRIIFTNEFFGTEMNIDNSFPIRELNFIKRVRNHVIDSEVYKKIKNRFPDRKQKDKIKYFYYNKSIRPGMEFDGCREVDLGSAFWITLNNLGCLTPELFEEGKKVSKQTRLAAVGTLAKAYQEFIFKGKYLKDGRPKVETPDPVRSELTEHVWNEVCYQVGRIMAKAARVAGKDFIFFWVDAIFIKGESEKKIQKLFTDLGYSYSSYSCEHIKFDKTKIYIKSKEKAKWVWVRNKETGNKERKLRDMRPFPYAHALSEGDIINLIS